MYKFKYIKPDDKMTPEEIAIHNIKSVDPTFKLDLIIASSNGWQNATKKGNYEDLEKLFRKLNCNTHIIAKSPFISKNTKLIDPIDRNNEDRNKQLKYEGIYSCRQKEYALKELLDNWKSYEENFSELKFCGVITIDNDNDMKNIMELNKEKIEVFDDNKKTDIQLITENKLLIIVEKISTEDYLKDIIKDIKNIYGKEPEEKLIGMKYDGSPIFAFIIDKKIVSDIGFSITHDKYGNKLIILVNLKIEK